MKIFVRKDVLEDLEKSYGVKYKYKKLINGRWRYYYVDGREESVFWKNRDALKSEIRTFIKDSYNDPNYNEYVKICDFPSHFADRLKLKTGFRFTQLTMNSRGIRHALNFRKHKIDFEDILLLRKVIQNKHTIIRDVGESKREGKKLVEFYGYAHGPIRFVLAMNEKNKELQLFDCYREKEVNKSAEFLCTSPGSNALDGLQPIIIISLG